MNFDYIENPILNNIIKNCHGDNGEKYLLFYKEKFQEIVNFMKEELSIYRVGSARIKAGQIAVQMHFEITRLLNFIESTRMNFKVYSNKEKAELESLIIVRKESFRENLKIELDKKKSKKEKDEYLSLFINSDKFIKDSREELKEITFSTEVLASEKNKLEGLKSSIWEFINILKKEM